MKDFNSTLEGKKNEDLGAMQEYNKHKCSGKI